MSRNGNGGPFGSVVGIGIGLALAALVGVMVAIFLMFTRQSSDSKAPARVGASADAAAPTSSSVQNISSVQSFFEEDFARGYRYVGCFTDQPLDRTMREVTLTNNINGDIPAQFNSIPGRIWTYRDQCHAVCREAAASLGFRYFALSDLNMCRVSNDLNVIAKHGMASSSDACGLRCSGQIAGSTASQQQNRVGASINENAVFEVIPEPSTKFQGPDDTLLSYPAMTVSPATTDKAPSAPPSR